MQVSQLVGAHDYPTVRSFISFVLDPQFNDVRAMLQLPRPDIGILPACNYAISATLCNLVSGISTTLYMPPEGRCAGSGAAFKGLVNEFFPYQPNGARDFATNLYKLCRNPLAHSVAILRRGSPIVSFTRVFHSSHDGIGWSDDELDDLEDPKSEYRLPHPGITVNGQHWTLHCDSFYFDVIGILRKLTNDSSQMIQTEDRFSRGIYNWR